jgi:hypothetical protein
LYNLEAGLDRQLRFRRNAFDDDPLRGDVDAPTGIRSECAARIEIASFPYKILRRARFGTASASRNTGPSKTFRRTSKII